MANTKHNFNLTRHQRTGALVALAFVAVTLMALWVTGLRTATPDADGNDSVAIEQFNASIDSLQARQAQRDSATKAKNGQHYSKRRQHDDGKKAKPHKPGTKRPAKRQPSAPRPLNPVPTF